MLRTNEIVAFGDFQTPDALAQDVTALVARLGIVPATILEPTCGAGSFLASASQAFPAASLIGADANLAHLDQARARALPNAELRHADFFATDWPALLRDLPQPWLILGNPPWVTVAGLARVGGDNAPVRDNTANVRGIEAITGRGNFDISEWMLDAYLRWLAGRRGAIAVLCKAASARKVLLRAWKQAAPIARARLFGIDAAKHFDVSVDAALVVIEITGEAGSSVCEVYPDLTTAGPATRFGLVDGVLVSDAAAFAAHSSLLCVDEPADWRSGIKHDCAALMELIRTDAGYRNSLGETIALEPACVYPLLKSSDLANGRTSSDRVMLVPQRRVGEDTARLAQDAPATWSYLNRHAARLAARRSAIYRGRPAFSIFGVGPYTFAPWKVAISGLYKRLAFACVGPIGGQPVVFDDTVSFLACADEEEARNIQRLLETPRARAFLQSMIFWSDKRPITTMLLRRLSLDALAEAEDYTPALVRAAEKASRIDLAPASMKL